MSENAQIVVALAGGGDEIVPAKSLSYIRRALDSEAWEEPEAASGVILGSLKITSRSSASDLAQMFKEHIAIIELSGPDNSLLYVHGSAVSDVDDAPTTMPGSRCWLVFGFGPNAKRLGVRQTREQLKTMWEEQNLDPRQSGI